LTTQDNIEKYITLLNDRKYIYLNWRFVLFESLL